MFLFINNLRQPMALKNSGRPSPRGPRPLALRKPARFIATILLAWAVAGCSDFGSEPKEPTIPDCPDTAEHQLNGLFGELVDHLYRIEVSQALFYKGVTASFETTVGGHAPIYTRQEVHDVTTAIAELSGLRFPVELILDEIDSLLVEADPGENWAPLFRRWEVSINSALNMGDSLHDRLENKARSILADLALNKGSPEAAAFSCQVTGVGAGFNSLEEFLERADRKAWVELFPAFTSCALTLWSEDWYDLIQEIQPLFARNQEPLLGGLSLFMAPDIKTSASGWSELEAWGEGGRTIQPIIVAPDDPTALSGPAVLVLIPRAGLKGSLYHTFFLNRPKALEQVPPGEYDILFLASGGRPTTSGPITIGPSPTRDLFFAFQPLNPEPCAGPNGALPLWVIDPMSGLHLSNPCQCDCRTEVWEGSATFQVTTPEDTTHIIRSTSAFRFVVSCRDASISGEGTGTVEILRRSNGECEYTGPAENSFKIQLSGHRFLRTVNLTFSKAGGTFTTTLLCPGEEAGTIDISEIVQPARTTSLELEGIVSTVEFPTGATLDSPFYISTQISRIF